MERKKRPVLFIVLIFAFVIFTTCLQAHAEGTPPPGASPAPVWVDIVAIVVVLGFVASFWVKYRLDIKGDAQREAKVSDLEKKVEDTPDKVKPVWELARFTLENYFKRNLSQVRQIFFVSVCVMIGGFAIILWGIYIAIVNPSGVKVGLISSASGILTEFISLTFMAIYRSTMSQANEYVAVLERINTVGMAVQVLDAMDNDDKASAELKNVTRVDIIRLLLTPPGARLPQPRSRIEKIKAKNATATD